VIIIIVSNLISYFILLFSATMGASNESLIPTRSSMMWHGGFLHMKKYESRLEFSDD